MLKRFVKFICVVLCIAMLVPFTAVAEGQMEYNASVVPQNQPKTKHIDITDGSWYANNCRYVYNTNLMIGTSENQFSPHIEMTREMAVVTVVKAILCYVNYGNKNYANNSYKNSCPLLY